MITEIGDRASRMHNASRSDECSFHEDPDFHIDIKTSPRFGPKVNRQAPIIKRSPKKPEEKSVCSKHNSRTDRSVTMGLEEFRRIPITDTEIVPFPVPHIPKRMIYGRVRK